MTDRDADRLELLDRIGDRVPELDLDQNEIEWTTLDDGHEAPKGGLRRVFAAWERLIDSGIRLYVRSLNVVLRHRVVPTFNAEAEGIKVDDIISRIVEAVPKGEVRRIF